VRAGGVSGVETYTLANLGPNRLTLTDANFAGVIGNIITVKCGSGENTVDASAVTGTHRIIAAVVPSFSTSLRGGAGNDVFTFSPFLAAFVATPTVTGGAGIDTLVLPGNGRVLTGRVSGVEVYRLGDDAAGTLVLANANFAGLGGGSISVYAGKAGDTVDAAALTGTDRVIVVGHAGKDVFTGGAGGDQFDFTAARLAGTDIVEGGAGNDRLYMTTAGTVRAAKVNGVERYRLAGGGGNSLTLANANFAGVTGRVITVGGGSGGNTVNAKALTGSNRVVLTGGAGADTFVAARHAAVTGGAGADRFELTTPGTAASPDTVTVADFAHGTDKVGFSKAGFGLGAAPLAETLFKANAAGGFTSSAQRFAYNTTSGALYYDRDGSRTGSSRQLIATLSHHPTLAATDLFFIA
jgi:Ca2+-binding RTX toxin-like protein